MKLLHLLLLKAFRPVKLLQIIFEDMICSFVVWFDLDLFIFVPVFGHSQNCGNLSLLSVALCSCLPPH